MCDGILVIRRQDELLHDPLDAGDDLSGQVRGRQVPRDELIGDADNVPQVVRQAEAEDRELVALQRVLREGERRQ